MKFAYRYEFEYTDTETVDGVVTAANLNEAITLTETLVPRSLRQPISVSVSLVGQVKREAP